MGQFINAALTVTLLHLIVINTNILAEGSSCAPNGTPSTFITPLPRPTLQRTIRRLVRTLRYIEIEANYLQSQYRLEISDSDMLQVLDVQPPLREFPSVTFTRGTNLNAMFIENYGRIERVRIFLEMLKTHENNRRLQRKIGKIIRKLNNVLCEIEIFVDNPIPFSSSTSLDLLPIEYRNMTQTQYVSWGYVLIRDLKSLLTNAIIHYQTLSLPS